MELLIWCQQKLFHDHSCHPVQVSFPGPVVPSRNIFHQDPVSSWKGDSNCLVTYQCHFHVHTEGAETGLSLPLYPSDSLEITDGRRQPSLARPPQSIRAFHADFERTEGGGWFHLGCSHSFMSTSTPTSEIYLVGVGPQFMIPLRSYFMFRRHIQKLPNYNLGQ